MGRIGRLETVAQWRRQIGKIFKAMGHGKCQKDEGTKLTYVANVGAQLAKVEQELAQVENLARQLEEVKAFLGSRGMSLQLPPPIEHDNQLLAVEQGGEDSI
jgi:hypothetical protein